MESQEPIKPSTENIKSLIESLGFSRLPNDILSLLSDDVNYKLTETVHIASQFMKHGFREKLSVDDINKAILWSNVPQTYGHNNSAPLTPVQTGSKRLLIDISQYIKNDIKYEVIPMESCRPTWIKVDEIANNINNSSDMYNEGQSLNLSKDLITYHELMQETILSNESDALKVAFEDLKTNCKISPLLPYFVKFMDDSIRKTDHMNQLCNILTAITSLLSNPSLYLAHYHKILVDSLFLCLEKPNGTKITQFEETENQKSSSKNAFDCWSFVEFVAKVLVCLLRDTSPVSATCTKIIEHLTTIIRARDKTLTCQYGALVTTIALGPVAVQKIIYPYLQEYLSYVNGIFLNHTVKNSQNREAAQKIYSALLNASIMFFKHVSQNPGFNNLTIYRGFYDYFGDAFISQLPIMELHKQHVVLDTTSLFASSKQTGEEMLKEIRESEDKKTNSLMTATNSTMQDDNCFKRDSSDSDSLGSSSKHLASTSDDNSHTVTVLNPMVILIKRKKNSPSSKEKDVTRSPALYRTPERSSPRDFEESPHHHRTGVSSAPPQNKPKTRWRYVNRTAMFHRKLQSGNLNVML